MAPSQLNAALGDPVFQQWLQDVAAMPAEKQVDAVARKLQELNPGFDGKVTGINEQVAPKIENGVVTDFALLTDNVTDIRPLRALAGLNRLELRGSSRAQITGRLTDLAPLQGMKLNYLDCRGTNVSDLSPLQGMPLTVLGCELTNVSNLSPLRGMPLSSLWLQRTKVSDLSPLAGMRLGNLACNDTQVSDLSPLKEMPLGYLTIENTAVSDLTPLEGMKLRSVTLTPRSLHVGLEILRRMPSVQMIGTAWNDVSPSEQFWKRYDAGEFGKPIATLGDPAFQQWMKAVAALPAERQVEAVARKLQELNPGFDGKVTGYGGPNSTPRIDGGGVVLKVRGSKTITWQIYLAPVRALSKIEEPEMQRYRVQEIG